MKPITLKELLIQRKPYPYTEIANKLNNLQPSELSIIDRIIAEGEKESCNMVGIKKLYKMINNTLVKDKMKELYQL